MISDADKAWAAGFFEGEGSIMISSRASVGEYGMLTCEATQVDRTPLVWFAARWPGPIYYIRPKNPQSRPFYRWTLLARKASAFLRDIQPFFVRPVMMQRAQVAIIFQDQKTGTHMNRTNVYRKRQLEFISIVRNLNLRGSDVEQATRVRS